MTGSPMQRYVDDLEGRLRKAAREDAARRWPGRVARRASAGPVRVVSAGLMVAAVLVAAVVIASAGSNTAPALAAPPAVNRAVSDISGLSGRLSEIVARDGQLSEARTIDVPGGKAYLIPVSGGWCLAVPDAETADPDAEYGSTCASNDAFARDGLQLMMGTGHAAPLLVAVLAAGARAPSLTLSSGERRRLHVERGVVATGDLAEATAIVFYNAAGESRTVGLPPLAPTKPSGDTMHDCGEGRIVKATTPC